MPLRIIMFRELSKNGMRAGHLWKMQQWLALRNRLDARCFDEFNDTIHNLLNEGLLREERNGIAVDFRLTEKGEATLYHR